MLQASDLQLLSSKGITESEFHSKLNNFKSGFPALHILKPAIIGDGIMKIDSPNEWIEIYDKNSDKTDVEKFVPASGAASRMFKDLFQYLENNDDSTIKSFIENLSAYPFYKDLKNVIKANGKKLEDLLENQQYAVVVDFLINEKGLNYGKLPKGLLKFHAYDDSCRLAIEEQIIEGIYYAKGKGDLVKLHFTVSSDHVDLFHDALKKYVPEYEEKFSVEIQYNLSIQKPSTDIVAVDENNQPARNKNGNLIFAPAGHGALIENLNEINADLVFLKNIDNVVPDWFKQDTVDYKKVLGGVMIKFRDQIFKILSELESDNISKDRLKEIALYLKKETDIMIPEAALEMEAVDLKKVFIYTLNRPIRVCGMVVNTGEPGGGPFWIEKENKVPSLQILEKAQFNLQDPEQEKIFNASTHFNPVDLACCLKNYKGEKFDLLKFTDPQMGFISDKVYGGQSVKIQELPGLWNGAMAQWITLFIEVPLSTFNPVKSHIDWLRKEHQPAS